MSVFCVTRPGRKAGFYRSEWLRGTVDLDEAESEARALLTDPRDTITAVYLWSDRHNQFTHKWVR